MRKAPEMRSDNNSIRIGKTAYLITILVVMLVALLMVVFIARRSQRFSNKRELKKIISCNVQLNELIIPDDWLSTEWYIAEKNQP
jgi:ABC-type phosphate transport system permease subunit